MSTGQQHPSDLDLELCRTGEADAEVRAHLEGCPTCRSRTELLERLAAELAPDSVEVPPERDAAILAIATERVRTRRPRRHWWWTVPLAAAAAALLVFLPVQRIGEAPALAAAPDINADGAVNIVDAMLLARALPYERRAEWDMNRDFRVDDGDVEAIAMAAVALGGRP